MSTIARVLLVLILIGTGLGAVFVGGHDVLYVVDPETRVLAATLCVAGLVILAAGGATALRLGSHLPLMGRSLWSRFRVWSRPGFWARFRLWRPSRLWSRFRLWSRSRRLAPPSKAGRKNPVPLSFLGSALAAAVYCALLYAQLDAQNGYWTKWLWGLLGGACLAGAGLLWLDTPRPRTLHISTAWLKSLLPLGVILAVAQFWYVNIYTPDEAEPSVVIRASFDGTKSMTSKGRRYTAARVVVHLSDPSNTQVDVLGSVYLEYGTHITPLRKEEGNAQIEQAEIRSLENGPPTNTSATQTRTLIGYGRVLGEYTTLQGHGQTDDDITAIDAASPELVSVRLFVVVARPDLLLGRQPNQGGTGAKPVGWGMIGKYQLVKTVRIQNSSWLDGLTRGKQYVRFAYSVNPNTHSRTRPIVVSVSPHACVALGADTTQVSCPPANPRYTQANNKFYGLSVDTADVEAIVPRPSRPKGRKDPCDAPKRRHCRPVRWGNG